jgi:hypothetical protein
MRWAEYNIRTIGVTTGTMECELGYMEKNRNMSGVPNVVVLCVLKQYIYVINMLI